MMFKKYLGFKPFTETEAWMLFKLAAFGEAVGWTLLITGITLGHLIHSNLPVLITGQLHGMLFLIYLAAAALVSPSLAWQPRKILLAVACGVPPYGSLAFELWQAGRQRRSRLYLLLHSLYLSRLTAAA